LDINQASKVIKKPSIKHLIMIFLVNVVSSSHMRLQCVDDLLSLILLFTCFYWSVNLYGA